MYRVLLRYYSAYCYIPCFSYLLKHSRLTYLSNFCIYLQTINIDTVNEDTSLW